MREKKCQCNACARCYRSALFSERLIRNAAFCFVSEDICGIEAAALTPAIHARLHLAASPFLLRGLTREHFKQFGDDQICNWICVFLWAVHPKYSNGKLRRWFFYRTIGRMNSGELIDAILEYVEEAFFDAGGGKKSKEYYSLSASLINFFGTRYGWSIEQTIHTPYKILFQLINAANKSDGQTLTQRSDEVLANWRERKAMEVTNGN